MSRAPLVVTPGDPVGIGPEVSVRALLETGVDAVLIGDVDALRRFAPDLTEVTQLSPGGGLRAMWPTPGPEPVEIRSIRDAVAACLRQQARAMVTGPIHKARLAARGFHHAGHNLHHAWVILTKVKVLCIEVLRPSIKPAVLVRVVVSKFLPLI